MEIKQSKVQTNHGEATLLEIQKNGVKVDAQNPVEVGELQPAIYELEVQGGHIVLISGMPLWAHLAVAAKVKNLFSVCGAYDTRLGFVVFHSVDAVIRVGDILQKG